MIERFANFAVLGGTFDPIHIAHLIIAQGVIQHLNLERCIFIPSANPPHKDEVTASAEHRLQMVRSATGDNPQFQVLDIELARAPLPSYTYDTIQELKRMFNSKHPIPFIVGADTLSEIPTWNNYPKLLEELVLVVVARFGHPAGEVEAEIKERILSAPIPSMEISSTSIRQRLAQGESIRYLVPSVVEEYITQNGLYRTA